MHSNLTSIIFQPSVYMHANIPAEFPSYAPTFFVDCISVLKMTEKNQNDVSRYTVTLITNLETIPDP